MKKKLRSLALFLTVVISLSAFPAHADYWSNEYYRVYDTTGGIDDGTRDELDQKCIDLVSTYRTDLGLLVIDTEELEDYTLSEYATEFYEVCGLGYGDTHDGFQFAYNVDTGEAVLLVFGRASELVDEDWLESGAQFGAKFYGEHGSYGVMYAAWRWVSGLFTDEGATPPEGQTEQTQREESSDWQSAGPMPDWYPADTQHFTFFHDENAPRVVDDADIIPEADERRMEARISELRAELGRDIVVFPDNSTHGLSRAVYAADFYDFNGYGYGDDREGFCLFICMEQGNRGFWTCGTGPDTKALHTEAVANSLDDVLYEYMAAGSYSEGVENWIENIATLYRKGKPFVPDWYPNRGESVERFHNASAARVVDELGLFSASELAELQRRAAELSAKYGADVIIHTSEYWPSLGYYEFADTYYASSGYGLGDDYDGVMMTCFRNGACLLSTYGDKTGEKISEVARNRMETRCEDSVDSGCYDALNSWLDQLEHVYKTGRAPRSLKSWLGTAIAGLIGGAVFGGVALLFALGNMRTKSLSYDADEYISKGGINVRKTRDDFTGTTTSRRYAPPKRESSDSGGGSSYSSSYSGSSGSSHSGSGRSF